MLSNQIKSGLRSRLFSLFPQRVVHVAVIKRFKFDKREANLWKKTHIERALDHFDDFYGNFYGNLWPSVRLAMLSTPKYCALVNNYGDSDDTIAKLKDMGCISIQEVFKEENIAKKHRRKRTHQLKTITQEPIKTEVPMEIDVPEVNPADRVIKPGEPSSAYLNYVPVTKLKGMEDWIEEDDQLKYVRTDDYHIQKQEDEPLEFPPLLNAFVFPRGDITRFPSPDRSSLGTSNFFLMDAASLLPVLALNLQPTELVLDMCAAPGGKSLAMLQTVYPSKLVSNDIAAKRVSRLKNVFNQYLGQTQSWKGQLEIRISDGVHWQDLNSFDKVLVDVPCTNDRHSVMEDDNNFFKPQRMKERISLPETQSALLCAGVRACKPGGTVVYSTCSLSPIQNDGVVHMAIKRLKEAYNIDAVVKDMSWTMKSFNFLCRFAPPASLRYGQTVLPSIINNFGPMYISKLKRIN